MPVSIEEASIEYLMPWQIWSVSKPEVQSVSGCTAFVNISKFIPNTICQMTVKCEERRWLLTNTSTQLRSPTHRCRVDEEWKGPMVEWLQISEQWLEVCLQYLESRQVHDHHWACLPHSVHHPSMTTGPPLKMVLHNRAAAAMTVAAGSSVRLAA